MNQNKMIKIAKTVWAFGETITMGSSIGEVIK